MSYTLIESLPGLAKSGGSTTLSGYLGWLFPFALTVAAVLAVIMIVIGGFELIGGGSEGLKTSGRKKIENAIYGLLLAVSAYLILNTINKDLITTSLSSVTPITEVKIETGTVYSPGYYFSYQNSDGSTISVGPYTDSSQCESSFSLVKGSLKNPFGCFLN